VGILFVSVDVPADLLPRNVRALDPVQLIAGRLRSAVRPEDTVGRMGGCEFVAIVNDLLAPADVDAIEQRLRDVLGVRVYLDESRSVLSVAVETRIGRPGDRAFELLAR
jgi:GGDEF domain-containing protein